METFERAWLEAHFARIASQFTPGEQTASWGCASPGAT